MTVTDLRAELVTRARAGDVRALDRLLAVTRPDLERYAKRHCESDDVDEAIQDALWILCRKLGGLRSVGAFTGWLFQVVRRACLGYARRRRLRASRMVSSDSLPLIADIDRGASDPELRTVLATIIAGLPSSYRDPILIKDVQGHSAEEMAEMLKISPEAAKSRLHRARAMVREALSEVTRATAEQVRTAR